MTPQQQATAHRKSVERVHQQIAAEHQAAAWRAQVPERLLRLMITAQHISGVSILTAQTDTTVSVKLMHDDGVFYIDRMLDYTSDEQEFHAVEAILHDIEEDRRITEQQRQLAKAVIASMNSDERTALKQHAYLLQSC